MSTTPCTSCGEVTCNCPCPDYITTGCIGETPLACTTVGIENTCLGIAIGDTGDEAIHKLAVAVCGISNNTDDKFVRVSSTDTTSKYLFDALEEGNNVQFTKVNSGFNEKLRVSVNVPSGNNPELQMDSSDNSLIFSQSGDKGHIVNARVAVSADSGNGISKRSDGVYYPVEDYKVKVNINDTPDFLENQIILLPDIDGIISSWTQSIQSGKVAFTPTFNIAMLCEKLTDIGCLNVSQPCNVTITAIGAITDYNGNAAITISYTGAVPAGFRYQVDGNIAVNTTSSTFVLTSLSSGSHTITVEAKCAEGTYGLSYQYGFEIPVAATPCPTGVTLTPTSTSIDVSWTLVPSASYTVELRSSLGGIPVQSHTIAVGTNVDSFGGLNSSTQYFVKVIAILNSISSSGCNSVSATTTAATCAGTINGVTITNENIAGTATATWTASNADSYEWRVDSGSWTPTTSLTASLTGLTSGSHTFYVRAKCSNGVYGTTASHAVTIPTPVCNVVMNSVAVSNPQPSGTATANWSGDAVGAYEYRIDSGSWIDTGSSATTANLTGISVGDHILSVRGRCSNGAYSNTVTTGFTIPATVIPVAPTVTTTAISNIASTTATSGGNVTSDGGATVTERGLVFATTANPTTSATKIIASSGGTGAFVSNLTGLTASTTYHVRAYAINSVGTAYGSDVSFTTSSAGVVVSWGWFDTDPFTALQTADTLTYQGSATITSGANIVASFASQTDTTKWEVIREPSSQPAKTTWFNNTLNNGTIPDSVFRTPFVANGFRYYVTRTAEVGFTTTETVVLS